MSVPTFLFTDIEGSTRLWERYPEAMKAALTFHDILVQQAIQAHGGRVFKTLGDGFAAVFTAPADAVLAALDAQRGCWLIRGDKQGRSAFGSPCTPDPQSHRLRDLHRPEHIFQLLAPQLPSEFPPLRSMDALPNNLPRALTSFIGRERESEDLKRLLRSASLVTIVGAGGAGKTRLALQVVADMLEEFSDGVWLVELGALAEPGLVPGTVASVLGVREEQGSSLMASPWRSNSRPRGSRCCPSSRSPRVWTTDSAC